MTSPLDAALRQLISQQAEAAAQRFIAGEEVENQYAADSDAGKYWKAQFERFLVLHSAPQSGKTQ